MVYFTNDIILNENVVIEIKNVEGDYSEWYLNSSILQCAMYKALIMACGGHLSTAKFFIDLGNDRRTIQMSNGFSYFLYFGEDKYLIDIMECEPFLSFLRDKIKAIKGGYTSATNFDINFKHKEFEFLQKYIKINKI